MEENTLSVLKIAPGQYPQQVEMQVSEDDETYQNPVDLLFEDLQNCHFGVDDLQHLRHHHGGV